MKVPAAVLAVMCSLLGGCSSGLKKTAAEAIDKSFMETSATVSGNIYYGRVGDKCEDLAKHVLNLNPTTEASYVAVEKAGVISVTADGPDYWKIDILSLTPEARERINGNVHPAANGCDYHPVLVAWARKSVVEVTRMNPITNETVEVEYKWKRALTPNGEKLVNRLSSSQLTDVYWRNYAPPQPDSRFTFRDLADSTAPRDGKAMLKKVKDGWEVAK
jgi:hypothetical protein